VDDEWVHASGEDNQGRCLACDLEDEAVLHVAEPCNDDDGSETYCCVCGHDIDLLERVGSRR